MLQLKTNIILKLELWFDYFTNTDVETPDLNVHSLQRSFKEIPFIELVSRPNTCPNEEQYKYNG